MTGFSPRLLHAACWTAGAIGFTSAGGYLIFGSDKGLGIFLVIIATITCRFLLLDLAPRFDAAARGESDPERVGSTDPDSD